MLDRPISWLRRSVVIQRNDNSGVKNNLDTTAQEIHSFLEVFHD